MNKMILVADDEVDARTMLKTFLEADGFQVIEAADGYEALDKTIKYSPDLVIMDMAMPFMDGVNSTRAIRGHESVSETPIVCLTAYGAFYDPRAREAGCTDVLHKPIDFSQLKPILDQYAK